MPHEVPTALYILLYEIAAIVQNAVFVFRGEDIPNSIHVIKKYNVTYFRAPS